MSPQPGGRHPELARDLAQGNRHKVDDERVIVLAEPGARAAASAVFRALHKIRFDIIQVRTSAHQNLLARAPSQRVRKADAVSRRIFCI